MSQKKVLVADYDANSLRGIASALEKAGFHTILVNNGNDVLTKIESDNPAVCIIDPMLPGVNGFTVSQKIRQLKPHLPIVISTAVYKGEKYRRDAKHKYGVTEYLEKPYSNEELVKTIAKWIKPSKSGLDDSLDRKLEFTLNSVSESVKRKAGTKKTLSNDLEKRLEHTLSGLEVSGSTSLGGKSGAGSGARSGSKSVERSASSSNPQKKNMQRLSTSMSGAARVTVPSQFEESQGKGQSPTMRVSPEDLQRELEKMKKSGPSPLSGFDPPTGVDVKVNTPPSFTPVSSQNTQEEKFTSSDIFGALIDEVEEEVKKDFKSKPAPKVAPQKKAVPQPAAQPAQTIGKAGGKSNEYQLISKIAAGGMAEVWKARLVGEKGFEKIVAIKKILPHLSDNQEFITMFIDEAKVAANLTHPNIAQIYELGQMDNSFFIAMEYVAGYNLRSVLSMCQEIKITLPTEIVTYIGMKLCSALFYAHTKKDYGNRDLHIVHRDISPQNILISNEGEIKLVDFGIAKASIKASQTVAGSLKGKLLYMSPEQAEGKAIDQRSDIFSLGNVMYESLTNHKLIAGDSELSILKNVRDASFEKPSYYNPKIPPAFESLLLKALTKDVDQRFTNAKAFEKSLKDYMQESKMHINESDVAEYLRALLVKDAQILAKYESRQVHAKPKQKASVVMPDTGMVRAHQENQIRSIAPKKPIPQPKKHSSNTWVWWVLAILLLGGAGAAYWYFYMRNDSTPPAVTEMTETPPQETPTQIMPPENQEDTDPSLQPPEQDLSQDPGLNQETEPTQLDPETEPAVDPNEALRAELEKKMKELEAERKKANLSEDDMKKLVGEKKKQENQKKDNKP